jgi:hypothetical protein
LFFNLIDRNCFFNIGSNEATGCKNNLVNPTAQSTAVIPASQASSASVIRNNPTHIFNVQLRKTIEQINKDTRSGKLTKTQAQADIAQVKVIRTQEIGFFKENGNRQLTSSQLTQLNQSLTQISSSL